jgi:hypothetical protein
MPKYIKCRIAGKGREYTYQCDDDTIQPGEMVAFQLPSGQTHVTEVLEVSDNMPSFPCKVAVRWED